MRPWHFLLTRARFSWLFPILLTLYVLALNARSLLMKIFTDATDIASVAPELTDNERLVFSIALLGGAFFFGVMLDWLRVLLFPRVFVAISRQEKEWKKRERIQYTIGTVIVLGLLISLFGNFIFEGISWGN